MNHPLPTNLLRVSAAAAAAFLLALPAIAAAADVAVAAIERVRSSVVAVGTFERTRTPQFQFRGSGFAVGDGTLIATNVHVLPGVVDPAKLEVIAVVLPSAAGEKIQVREARRIAADPNSDLAILRIDGAPMPALALRDSDTVKEGETILFTGFPIGPVLGAHPATHRGMVAAISPIAIPQGKSSELDSQTARRLASGAYPVFQLDATAYPGNSGSPVYDPESGAVVAIINMVFVKGTKESMLTQPSGIAYAIPSRHLKALLEKAR
jgi:serine protease Do